jgi:hypothetical protein
MEPTDGERFKILIDSFFFVFFLFSSLVIEDCICVNLMYISTEDVVYRRL